MIRSLIQYPKYEVLKATLSTRPTATKGSAAQRTGMRRAQPETSSSQA